MHKTRKRQPSKRSSRLAIARALLFFFVFLGLELLLENRDEIGIGESSSCDAVHADATPWMYDVFYPRLTQLLLTEPSSRKVAIVFIPEGLSEVQGNICRGRAYLAALIDVLHVQGPAAIVLDKYFSTETCTSDDLERSNSAALQRAVKRSVSDNVPVIAGEATEAATQEAGESCLVRKPDFQLFGQDPSFHYGLTKLNSNREQIPLAWRVLDQQPPSPPAPVDSVLAPVRDSLSLLAIKIAKKEADDGLGYTGLRSLPRHPYTRLDVAIDAVRSDQVLCCRVDNDGRDSRSLAGPSTTYSPSGPLPFSIKDRVVVIGSQSVSDRWLILGRKRWGYELQAAYIDALLSGSYLKAIPGLWIFLLPILFLLLLEAIPAIAEFLHCERDMAMPRVVRSPELWLVVWSLVFPVLLFAVCSSRGYLPPLSVLIGVALTLAGRGIFIGMEYFKKQSVPDRKEAES